MFSLAKTLSNASAKLVATFFMVIVLMLLSFAFFPNGINMLKEWIQHFMLSGFMLNPPMLNAQGEMLFDMLINDSTVFGIIMTLTARMIVEVIFWSAVRLWHMVNPPETEPDVRASV